MTIFITGDRSNFIKSILIVSFLIFFYKIENILNKQLYYFNFCKSDLTILISTNQVFKERFQNKILNEFKQNEFNINKFVKQTEYGKIYNSAYELF